MPIAPPIALLETPLPVQMLALLAGDLMLRARDMPRKARGG